MFFDAVARGMTDIGCVLAGCTELPTTLELLRERSTSTVRSFLARVDIVDPMDAALAHAGNHVITVVLDAVEALRAALRGDELLGQELPHHLAGGPLALVKDGDLIELDVAKSAVRNLTTSKTKGVPYWGEGQIHIDGLKRMIEAQRSVGAIQGEVDYNKIIDTRFLPDDLKKIR